MSETSEKAINSVNSGIISFCRFITANDTGETGSHQSGFYIPRSAYSLFFDVQGRRGNNEEKFIKIKWQNDFETESRAIYYGRETRNEYRLTRFGKDFPFFTEAYIGALLIITKVHEDYYRAFVLNQEEDIENFLDSFGMSPVDTNSIINKQEIVFTSDLEILMDHFLANLPERFPDTTMIADAAREITNKFKDINNTTIENEPDRILLDWLNTEYELFKKIEIYYYSDQISHPFKSVASLIDMANTILNRRKSRAGKSLEHHLDTSFKINGLKFSHPGKTEGYKKPDFIFPGNSEYQSSEFDTSKLIFLAAKTTCKDRWRQILNEASKIRVKYLFTLQQGISKNQLDEMYESNVILVVPQSYIEKYPLEYREKIFNLKSFINYAKERQNEL